MFPLSRFPEDSYISFRQKFFHINGLFERSILVKFLNLLLFIAKKQFCLSYFLKYFCASFPQYIYVVANVQIQLMYTLADMFQLMYTLAENQLMYYRLAS